MRQKQPFPEVENEAKLSTIFLILRNLVLVRNIFNEVEILVSHVKMISERVFVFIFKQSM